jgi:hypothetical protein
MVKIFLFDIDGVLLKPHGYRKAFFDTFSYWMGLVGIKANLPEREILSLFEAYGITNEWDMLAICMSIILDRVCVENEISIRSHQVKGLMQELSEHQLPELQVNYRDVIQQMASIYHLHEIPCVSVFQNCNAAHFPALYQQPILEDVLCTTRNMQENLCTNLFQNHILGSDLYQQTYQRPAWFNCESYLGKYDLPIVSEEWVGWIKDNADRPEIKFVGLTARPSKGPRSVEIPSGGAYSPEAELAMEVMGLPNLLFIAYGKLQYLADQLGITAEEILKPSSFHALAAIFTSLVGDEWIGLQQAAGFMHRINSEFPLMQSAISPMEIPMDLELSVFEDSQGGIKAVMEAADLLRSAGIRVTTIPYGITQNKDKANTLESLGVTVFPTINEALSASGAQ